MKAMKKDNLLPGFDNWTYRFIVMRRLREKKEKVDMSTFQVINSPADAYYIYNQLNIPQYTNPNEEWILVDSFGKNALEFCRQQEEKYVALQKEI